MLESLQNVLIYGGSFVAVLSLVVFVHEFGHFQAARWSRVAIDTFSIGFGKTLWSGRDRQGVTWRLAALPLGGYVKFTDDADPSSTTPAATYEDPAAKAAARRKGLFHAQPVAIRSFVMAAGPLMNFVFAILAFAALAMIVGRDVTDRNVLPARVDAVRAESPAAQAGLMQGDVVVALDGRPVDSFGAFQDVVQASAGREIAIEVRRDGQIVASRVTPGSMEVMDATGATRVVGVIGIERRLLPEERVVERLGPIEAVGSGAAQTWGIIAATGAYLGNILTGKASAEHIAGPAGILQQSGDITRSVMEQTNIGLGERLADLLLSLLQWAANLSVAVGIVNLLPVPVLDGGHLVFYAIEAVRGGKPLPAHAQEWAVCGGLAVILCLLLFATWNDLQRLFG